MNASSVSGRRKMAARAAENVAKEMTPHQLRRARMMQVRIAKELQIRQEGVSRLKKRSDLLLSTLRKSVRAMVGLCSQ